MLILKQVDFERHIEADESPKETNTVRRVLFDKNNQYPQKKVMTFNKHTTDFGFRINYGDLSFLRESIVQLVFIKYFKSHLKH